MIFGFIGTKAVGKTTAAEIAARLFDGKVFSFAGDIHVVCDVLGLEHSRKNMVNVGTGLRKALHADIWIQSLARKALGQHNSNLPIFIDDVRHPNEIDFIHKMGGKVIGIITDLKQNYEFYQNRGKNGDDLNYQEFVKNLQSEFTEKFAYELMYGSLYPTNTHYVDSTIYNNKTITDLEAAIYQRLTNYICGQSRKAEASAKSSEHFT